MITIKQLSIFLENKNGRINDVAKVLAKEGINMQAFSMAETADFGILRLIVSDVEKAVNALRTSDFAVMLTDVVCIQCPNTPGSLSAVLDYLAAENIFIEYMYAFSEGDTARTIIRPTDLKKCIEILQKNHCKINTIYKNFSSIQGRPYNDYIGGLVFYIKEEGTPILHETRDRKFACFPISRRGHQRNQIALLIGDPHLYIREFFMIDQFHSLCI